jgi:WD40 repeat protein
MPFCTNCGCRMDGGAASRFCSMCGARRLPSNLPKQLPPRAQLSRKHKLVLAAVASVAGLGLLTAGAFYQSAANRMSREEVAQWQQAGVDRPSATLEHERAVTALSFSPNGRLLVTADEAGVYTWDATTWRKTNRAWKVPSKITSLTFSPAGSRLVAIDEYGAARILDLAGTISHTIEGVQAAVFSPDSARLMTLGKKASVWDAATGEFIRNVAVPNAALFGGVSAFSPDGGRWVASASDETFKVIATATGTELSGFRAASCNMQATSVAISADNSKILAAGRNSGIAIADGCLIIMDNRSHEVRSLQFPDRVLAAAFSPDGSRVATASADGKTQVFDIVSGQAVYVLKDQGHQEWDEDTNALAFSPNGSRLAVAGEDKRVRVWDIRTLPGEQTAHRGNVMDLVFSPDGTEVLGSGVEVPFEKPSFRLVRVWSASDGHAINRVTVSDDADTGASLSADGRSLALFGNVALFGGGDGARILDVRTGQLVRTLTDSDWMSPVIFSPDGTRIAATRSSSGGNHTRWVEIWEVSTGRHLFDLKAGNQRVGHCVFSPDGSILVTDTSWPWAGTVVWDVQTGLQLYDLKSENARVVFSRDSTKLLISLLDERHDEPDHYLVQIRETRNGRVLRALADSVEKSALDLSPDGSRVMVGGDDGVARMWDVATGNLLIELHGHAGPILWVTFSHDGSLALTTGEDGTARIWDALTGRQLQLLGGHQNRVYGARFSPDDSRVATVTEDRVWLWDARAGGGFELK